MLLTCRSDRYRCRHLRGYGAKLGLTAAVLLRESYREAGKVKNRTLANLSSWPEAKVDALVLRRRKVAKHFTIDIGDEHLSYARDQDSITTEAALDSIYVLRTSVGAGGLDSSEVVSSYKALAQVERAFRAFNTDLDIRPIRHRTETRVRTHVFLRMLSYYITWHMHARLAPLLFTDDDKAAAEATRPSPVAPAARSPRALAKAAAKHTPGGLPVHSFTSLLADLATICLNQIQPADPALPGF
jgi:hypothetical protein